MSTKTKTTKQADKLLAARKEHYTVPEVAPALAEILGITEAGARSRLYRAVEDGRLKARSYVGAVRLPYHEAERTLRGESF